MGTNEDYCVYEVKPGDSISAIAAHFGHITPTQLARINRLSTLGSGLPTVFPGQKILVPIATSGRIPISKFRRAPGSALRVTCSNSDSSCQIGSLDRSKLECSDSREESDKLFVKAVAERMLSSGELMDGILLVTPDCLIFDAKQTALDNIQAYSASRLAATTRRSVTMEPICAQSVQTTDSSSSSPDLLRGIGLYLPLEQISSMSTVNPILHHTPAERSRFSSISVSTGDNGANETDQNGSNSPAAPNTLTDSAEYPEPGITKSSSVVMNEGSQPETTKSSNSGDSPSSLSPHPELPRDARDAPSSPTSLKSDALMLQLTEISTSDDEPKRHCFILSANDLQAVIAFLLKVVVPDRKGSHFDSVACSIAASQAACNTTVTATSTSIATTSTTAMKRQISHSSSGHRSVVEEVLEAMDTVSLTPIPCGGESGILSEEMLAELGVNFPTHWIGANMKLVYRADQDGYSLSTMYRKSRYVEDGVILLIRDTMNTVFGAILSERPRCSKHFYGTGETCVFHWSPVFKRYDWTKKNYFFIFGSADSFQVGGQSGRNAIWIDEALKYGRSEPTDTFDNPVLSGCLPAFASDILTDSQTTPSPTTEDIPHRIPLTTGYHVPSNVHHPSMDSMPFVIDTLELWELVS